MKPLSLKKLTDSAVLLVPKKIKLLKPHAVSVGAGAMAVLIVYGQYYSSEQEILKHAKEWSITRVIDGDTVEITAPYLPPPLPKTLSLRIDGIDTPEKGHLAKCKKEEKKSEKAAKFTEEEINKAKSIIIRIDRWGKYGGRVLGDIVLDNKKLSKKLIDNRYAVWYTGEGKKKDWCK